jgi:hypothetical protein
MHAMKKMDEDGACNPYGSHGYMIYVEEKSLP